MLFSIIRQFCWDKSLGKQESSLRSSDLVNWSVTVDFLGTIIKMLPAPDKEISSSPILFLVATVYIWLFSSRENENVLAKNLCKKVSITLSSIIFMILSKDNKGIGPKYNPDPDLIIGRQLSSKTVIFIR